MYGKDVESFLAQLGVTETGLLRLTTKYYDTEVSISRNEKNNSQGAIIILDSFDTKHDFSEIDNDEVKILFTSNEELLEECIDRGFELVTPTCEDEISGIERVLEALKARVWKGSSEVSASLLSFESLMDKMQEVRTTSMSDAKRREMAESIALQFSNFFDSDED